MFGKVSSCNACKLNVFNIISESADISTLATVLRPTPHSATIKFAPTPDQQRKLSTDGIKGQLAVLYDVDRSTFPSQLLVSSS